MKPVNIFLDSANTKSIRTVASGHDGHSSGAGGVLSTPSSFPEALHEAGAMVQQNHSKSSGLLKKDGPAQGLALTDIKTGQSGELKKKKSDLKTDEKNGAAALTSLPNQFALTPKQFDLTDAGVTDVKGNVAGSLPAIQADTFLKGVAADSSPVPPQTVFETKKDTGPGIEVDPHRGDIAGIIGSLITSGLLKERSQGANAIAADMDKNASGIDKESGKSGKFSFSDVQVTALGNGLLPGLDPSGNKNTSGANTSGDDSLAGAGGQFNTVTGGTDASSAIANNNSVSNNRTVTGNGISDTAQSLEIAQAGEMVQSGISMDKAEAGASSAKKDLASKVAPFAEIKTFAELKTKGSEDTKTKGDFNIRDLKIKEPAQDGKPGAEDKTGTDSGQQGNGNFAQNDLSGTAKKETGEALKSGQNILLQTASRENGDAPDLQNAALKGKFSLTAGIADAKSEGQNQNMQSGLKDDGKTKTADVQAGQAGSQTSDKGSFSPLTPGNTGSTNSFSDRLQTETAKASRTHDEPFVVTKQADNSLEVRIEPEGLGKLDIKLSMEKGHLNAHINASESIGKEAIERSLGSIVSKLAGEGINVGSFSVSLRNRKNGERQGKEDEDKSAAKIKTVRMEQDQKIQNAAASAGGSLLSLFA